MQVRYGGYDFKIKLENSNKASVFGYPSQHTKQPDVPVVDTDNVNLMSYINSKLVYAMRHTKDQVDSLYDLFHQQRCNIAK